MFQFFDVRGIFSRRTLKFCTISNFFFDNFFVGEKNLQVKMSSQIMGNPTHDSGRNFVLEREMSSISDTNNF